MACILALGASLLGTLAPRPPSTGALATGGELATAAAGPARVSAGLQAAIDKTLAAQPVTSPAGVTLSWGPEGTVSFHGTKAASGSFALRPKAVARASSVALSPGPFVFAPTKTSEVLGDGATAWYKTTERGFEQGFTLAHRPGGATKTFSVVLSYGGSMQPSLTGSGSLSFAGPAGPAMTYGALRVTDAKGKALAAHLSLAAGQVRITVDDVGAVYPISIDPFIAPSSAPVATFTGTGGEDLGYSVALSADGQAALVGAPFAGSGNGAAYLYAESAGVWPTTPSATFTGSGDEGLGSSVALSADGQVALVGGEIGGSNSGAAYVYTESAGAWLTTPAATFTGSGHEELGLSVALSADGQVALVGAPFAGGQNGAAYVYTESAGAWPTTATASFIGSGNEQLGYSVALSANGQVALVGAQAATVGNGAAYVYSESAGAWPTTPSATFTGSGGDNLGYSVALSADGQVALVGSPGAGRVTVPGPSNGAAYLYAQFAGAWPTTPAATFTGTGGEDLGASVALSADGQVSLVGAPLAGGGNGAAYLYAEAAGVWTATPTASFNGSGNERLGSVALSADGQVALVSAYEASVDNGAAYVFRAPGTSWSGTPVATFTSGGAAGLAYSVALSANGQEALLGAPYTGFDNGAVYLYAETGGAWPTTPTASFAGSGGEELGFCVALSAGGQVALVGAPGAGSGNGATYLYAETGAAWPTTPTASFAGNGGESLGWSAALSADGQMALVGAPTAGSVNGAAYIYAEAAGTWPTEPSASFTSSSGGYFGSSVALSADGQVALLGAPYANSENGAAYIYAVAAGAWPGTPTASFTGSGGEALGWSVALSADGQVALLGAPYANSENGAAYVYAEAAGGWPTTPAGGFTGSGGERLGGSVALSADSQVALVGAPDAGSGNGAAYVYADAAGTWPTTPSASFTSSSGGNFGSSVALSADGELALLGAPEAISLDGAAYVYNALPMVTVEVSGSQAYGSSAPAFRYTDDAPSGLSLSGALSCSEVETGTAIDASLGAGSYAVDSPSCSGLSLSGTGASSYVIAYLGTADGFVVSPAPLSITASSPAMTYGGPVPAVSATYGGFVNGEGASSLTTVPTCSTTATSSSPVGSYPSNCSGAVDPNYSITYVGGTVSVSTATLTITATSTTMTYGGTVPEITPAYSPSPVSLTTAPTCSTSATSSSPTGSYPATCTGAVGPNYAIGYASGIVVVIPATLTVTASSATFTQGEPVPAITPTYAGFVNGDSAASLSAAPACSTTATSSSPPGSYPATCTGAADADYAINYVVGTVTVVAAPVNSPQPVSTTTPATVPPKPFPGADVSYPNGAIVSFGRADYVLAGGRAFVASARELRVLEKVDHARVVSAPRGAAPPTRLAVRAGTLICTKPVTGSPTIYVAGPDGELHGFSTSSQFFTDGYDAALVVTVPGLSGLTVGSTAGVEGPAVSALSTRADGAIADSAGTFYVFAGGRAFGIPTPSELLRVRAADRGVVLHGLVGPAATGAGAASGALLSAPGKVYVSYQGSVYLFESLAQLAAYGYGGSAAVPVPGAGDLSVVSPYSGS